MGNNLKTTDLRIGNYLYSLETSKNQIVTGIVNDSIFIHALTFDTQSIKNFKPIQLTEEWLDRLGFYSKYKSNHKMWNIFGFDLHQISDEDEDGNKIPQEQIFYYAFSYEIKYVHQLQNLYFALTGEELTIKEQ